MVSFLRYQLLYFKPFQASCLACILHLPGTGNIQIGGRTTHLTDLIYSLYTRPQQKLTMHLAPFLLFGGCAGGWPCHIFQKHPTAVEKHPVKWETASKTIRTLPRWKTRGVKPFLFFYPVVRADAGRSPKGSRENG